MSQGPAEGLSTLRSPRGTAALPRRGFSLQRHLVQWMNHYPPSRLCAATATFGSLLSKIESTECVGLLGVQRGRKAPLSIPPSFFFFLNFIWKGKRRRGDIGQEQ